MNLFNQCHFFRKENNHLVWFVKSKIEDLIRRFGSCL